MHCSLLCTLMHNKKVRGLNPENLALEKAAQKENEKVNVEKSSECYNSSVTDYEVTKPNHQLPPAHPTARCLQPRED